MYGETAVAIFLFFFAVSGNPDAPHITAIAGDKITLNCDVNFPNGVVSPYVVQWWRKVSFRPLKITSFSVWKLYVHEIFRGLKFHFIFGMTTILNMHRKTTRAEFQKLVQVVNMDSQVSTSVMSRIPTGVGIIARFSS